MEIQDEFGENPTLPGTGDNYEHKELPRGSSIDRYLIVEPIGAGAMGAVYRAYDPKLNRGVALKILSVKQDDLGAAERAKTRIIREAQALAQLSHPNVVAVHDYGSFGDDVFIAMELVEGKTLDEWLRQKKRSVKEILEVMLAAGRGLSAAHKAGLVHRDFKPGNVIVGDDGRVRVLDFGVARVVDEEHEEEPKKIENSLDVHEMSSDSSPILLNKPMTEMGGVVGTPMYMAPEQHLGQKTDERTDQFGFCVVLYEALFGKKPFAARTLEELKEKVVGQKVRQPPADTAVPVWLWHIILKGLRVNPEERYPTIEPLLDDLEADPEEARASRRKKQIGVVLIILIAILPFGLWKLLLKGGELCTGADIKRAGVWSDEIKEKVKQSFVNTKLSYSRDSFFRVEQCIEKYLKKWARAYTETCAATRIRGEQSEEIMDLRMGCLNKHLIKAGALIKVFSNANKDVVERAIQAFSSLAVFSDCDDLEALRSRIPQPRDEKTKNKVEAIRVDLADVEAFTNTGKYREGLALAQKLEKEANAIAYLPVQAEALYWLGQLLNKTGEFGEAENALYAAANAAGESGDALLAVYALRELVEVVGYNQAQYEVGLYIARDAKVMLDLARGTEMDHALLLDNTAALFWSKGSYEKASNYNHRALAIYEKTLGSDHPHVSSSLNNLGGIFRVKGEYEKALEYLHRSLAMDERTLGPDHPYVSWPLYNIGCVYRDQGKYDRALEYHFKALTIYRAAVGSKHSNIGKSMLEIGEVFRRQGKYDKALYYSRKSLQIFEKALGPEHPHVAWSLGSLANVFINKGIHQQAVELLERAVKICKKMTCQPIYHGRALFSLAQVLLVTDGDKPSAGRRTVSRERAIKLAKQAHEIFEKTPKAFKKELKEINAWLKKTGVKKNAKRLINDNPR